MPITYFAMLASTLAIAGVPFFAGFYSKDAILGRTLARAHLSEGNGGIGSRSYSWHPPRR